ncbi:hypothetical protein AGDE_15479 [Angomonas deanei]|uniref:Uncharacterized protein n=1 Tax=Angomonas deanei TaxID=59799 RepID=A0A7G2C3X9_9TRYP|nr:hypothetical protein AGDE_15479 [Angomonas deanei]CAD2214416.1 hypothetical protein, conserved [Angomonas deanei]|eukprot:EPY19000.1 hypothetical protein AGDE_15479 [Angomonas deanei]
MFCSLSLILFIFAEKLYFLYSLQVRLHMSDTVSAATALQEENRKLQERVNELMDEKMAWVEEKKTLQDENRELREKYDELKTEYDELVAEHRDYTEEMVDVNTRLKAELGEARSDLTALRETLAEEEELIREMCVTKEMDDLRLCLTEKCYARMTGQFDLFKMFKYCKENCISAHVIKETLNSDHRETLTLPKKLKSSVGDANVKEFFETIVAALPKLKSITGYPEGVVYCYVIYRKGSVALSVLKAYCSNIKAAGYKLTQDEVNTLQSAGLSVSEYLSTVIPLLPEVMSVSVYESNITTLDWCAALPDRITRIDISDCPNIQDCTPLLKMKGLKCLYCPAVLCLPIVKRDAQRVLQELSDKGVKCEYGSSVLWY